MNITHESFVGIRSSNLDGEFFLNKGAVSFFIVIDGFSTNKDSSRNLSSKQELFIKKFIKYIELVCSYAKNVEDLESFICFLKNKKHLYVKRASRLQLKASIIFGCIIDDMLSIYHLGDCRLYLNGKLYTSDDSVAWHKIKNKFKNKDLEFIGGCCTKHPERWWLTKSFPKNFNDPKFISQCQLTVGDVITVCTDGFWNLHHSEILSNKLNIKAKKYIDNSTYIQITI